MAGIKSELVGMLNKALELEHAARIQYLAHAELVGGLNAGPVVERLKEIAGDEAKHEEKFRTLIGSYLGGEPSMGMSETHHATGTNKILEVNRTGEREAIDFYKQIYKTVSDHKAEFPYEFEVLEHEIRHVILDEEEHVAELSVLLA